MNYKFIKLSMVCKYEALYPAIAIIPAKTVTV